MYVLVWCLMQNRKMLLSMQYLSRRRSNLVLEGKQCAKQAWTSCCTAISCRILPMPSFSSSSFFYFLSSGLIISALVLPRHVDILSSIRCLSCWKRKEGAGNKRSLPFQGPVVFMGVKILFKDFVFKILLCNTLLDGPHGLLTQSWGFAVGKKELSKRVTACRES